MSKTTRKEPTKETRKYKMLRGRSACFNDWERWTVDDPGNLRNGCRRVWPGPDWWTGAQDGTLVPLTRLLKARQVATLLDVPLQAVYHAFRMGVLGSFKVKSTWWTPAIAITASIDRICRESRISGEDAREQLRRRLLSVKGGWRRNR